MSNDQMTPKENFGASKTPGGGTMSGPSIEERKKQLRKKMAIWGSISAAGLAVFLYAFFGQFLPAVKEYRMLVAEQIAPTEKLKWQKIRKTAEGKEILVAQGEMPASEFQRGPRLRGELTVRAFRPDPQGEYIQIGATFMPAITAAWTDALIGSAWAGAQSAESMAQSAGGSERYALGAMRYALIAERGPLKNLIPNAAETALRDCFNANAGSACTASVATFKFHGIGTGTVDPAEANTGCGTELTTEYNPDSTRATGSQTTNGANVYRTVGTNTIDSGTPAVTEWCLHQAATGAVTMWSRVEFAAINLAANDSLQTTYDLTIE
jgi:hypothetical protein